MESDTRGDSNGWKSGLITGGVHACRRGHPRVKRESRRHLNSLISGRERWQSEHGSTLYNNTTADLLLSEGCRVKRPIE